MGKRYYCDFCDRSFADSANNRKNHFKGALHQRLRKQHYDSFKDASARIVDEAAKAPCKRFMTTGSCDYGDECRYSHMTQADKQELHAKAEQEKINEQGNKRRKVEPKLEDWLAKRKKNMNQEDKTDELESFPQYELPPFLANVPNLPPSLQPPTADDFRDLQPLDWG